MLAIHPLSLASVSADEKLEPSGLGPAFAMDNMAAPVFFRVKSSSLTIFW
jgi:hypothetical protein